MKVVGSPFTGLDPVPFDPLAGPEVPLISLQLFLSIAHFSH